GATPYRNGRVLHSVFAAAGIIDSVIFPNQPPDEASSNPIFDFWHLPLPLIGLAILIWLCERKK
ncbi:hypothetical protein, partial [Pseudomonas aeruginosa]|uniref:hypothetical protein n=1 Tax=Pseudomonas aeruginosa TaxID=287 RepID=UPI001E647308